MTYHGLFTSRDFPFRTRPGYINTLTLKKMFISSLRIKANNQSARSTSGIKHKHHVNHERRKEIAFHSIRCANTPKLLRRVGSLAKATRRWAGKACLNSIVDNVSYSSRQNSVFHAATTSFLNKGLSIIEQLVFRTLWIVILELLNQYLLLNLTWNVNW